MLSNIEEETTRQIKADYPFLWEHQLLGVCLAEYARRFNFYYETRTGKTLMSLSILHRRIKLGRAKRCLIVCPSSIIKSWLGDAEKFPELRVVAYYGDDKQKAAALQTPAHIILWSTELLAKNIELVKKIPFDVCFFDESSKLKSHKSEVSKAALDLSLHIPSWYNLSATPAPNNEAEYYTQMRCIDYCVFHPSRTHFVSKYFNNVSRNTNYEKLVIKPEMKDEFMRRINEYSIYVDQKVMPVSKSTWHLEFFNLGSAGQAYYNNMKNKMSVEIEGAPITVDMAVAMRAKLNQITSGFVMDTEARKENAVNAKLGYDEDLQEVYRLGDRSRIDTLANLLNNIGKQKVVIWANYTEEFRMLEELLGSGARYIRGGTSITDKEQYIYQEFKKGDLQYLVCHPLSVGMGINLTEAHHAIYYSLNDSWEALKQSSERIRGHITVQPNDCHYYVILASGTVNELIYENVSNKRDASLNFLDYLQGKYITDLRKQV